MPARPPKAPIDTLYGEQPEFFVMHTARRGCRSAGPTIDWVDVKHLFTMVRIYYPSVEYIMLDADAPISEHLPTYKTFWD